MPKKLYRSCFCSSESEAHCIQSSMEVGKKGFSLNNAASSKRVGAEQNCSTRKIPKVGDMKMESPRQSVITRPQTNAPVNMCVYKITDASGDVWPSFPDTKLWQIQINHDARPSVSVAVVQGLNDYLKQTPGAPENVQKLQSEAGIKIVLTNLDDPDSLGCFVQYRVGLYVAGEFESMVNAFMLLDGYLQFKMKQLARASHFEGTSFVLPSNKLG